MRILPRVYLGLGLMLLPRWLLIPFGSHHVLALLLIASKQLSFIALPVFFIAIGDLINARQSTRLIAPLIAGFTLGGIADRFATRPLGDLIGISSLLPFACAMMFAAARAAMPLYRLRPTRLEHGLSAMRGFRAMARSSRIAENAPKLRRLWNEGGLFRLLFVPALCAGILGPMLIFEFFHVVEIAMRSRWAICHAQRPRWRSLAIRRAQCGRVRCGIWWGAEDRSRRPSVVRAFAWIFPGYPSEILVGVVTPSVSEEPG